jgi:hypothetical protein
MATRYFVNTDTKTIYASDGPDEHKPVKLNGFVAFSPWDVIRWGEQTRDTALVAKAGFNVSHMLTLTQTAKAGTCFGTYKIEGSRLVYLGSRFIKVGRGKYELRDRSGNTIDPKSTLATCPNCGATNRNTAHFCSTCGITQKGVTKLLG